MDIEARRMNQRALAVVFVALAIVAMSWAVGARNGCASGAACASPAVESKTSHRAKSDIIGAAVHIVDPDAPHELAAL